jgi:hypothetical protein
LIDSCIRFLATVAFWQSILATKAMAPESALFKWRCFSSGSPSIVSPCRIQRSGQRTPGPSIRHGQGNIAEGVVCWNAVRRPRVATAAAAAAGAFSRDETPLEELKRRVQQLSTSPYDNEIRSVALPALVAMLLEPVMNAVNTGPYRNQVRQCRWPTGTGLNVAGERVRLAVLPASLDDGCRQKGAPLRGRVLYTREGHQCTLLTLTAVPLLLTVSASLSVGVNRRCQSSVSIVGVNRRCQAWWGTWAPCS